MALRKGRNAFMNLGHHFKLLEHLYKNKHNYNKNYCSKIEKLNGGFNMHHAIKTLVKIEYIKKSKNGRLTYLELTPKGNEMYIELKKILNMFDECQNKRS
jgi:hypothetical protein